MGSIIGQKIDYNGAGALRVKQHIPSKHLPKYPPPPTRDNNSATLIDTIFTNKFTEYYASGNIVCDIADHFSQFCIFRSSIDIIQPLKITIRDYSKLSEQRLLQDLPQLNWESLFSGNDDAIFYFL